MPGARRSQPGERLGQLALAVAGHAGDAEHLAAAHGERDVVDRDRAALARHAQPGDDEAFGAEVDRSAVGNQLDRPPHHQVGELLATRRRRQHLAGDRAVAHDCDAVGERQHLVELVGDEHQAAARAGDAAQGSKQLLDLAGCQHRCRLVEHEQPRHSVEHLEDLDALALADRQLPHVRRRIDVHLVGRAELREAGGDGIEARPAQRVAASVAAGVAPEGHVLGDRQRRHEHEVLVDHAHAGGDGVGWRPQPQRFTVEQHLTGVGLLQAEQDLHQRRLAGAVLAQQGMHLAAPDVEVDAVVGHDAGKRLGDAAHLQQRRPRRRGRRHDVRRPRCPPAPNRMALRPPRRSAPPPTPAPR